MKNGPTIPIPTFEYERSPDEEFLEIRMNGNIIASLSHDMHGWEGMSATESAVRAIESHLEEESHQ